MKYTVELWCSQELINKYETNDFELAKNQYIKWHNEYDEKYAGATNFKIGGELTSIEWDWVNLLGNEERQKPWWELK